MAAKGSIAIEGVSLTLAAVADGGFSVAVIPTTLAETTLGGLRVGAKVNIETDIIGKYVLKFLRQMGQAPAGTLTIEKLRDAGFA
jgi:riboflavin synthase